MSGEQRDLSWDNRDDLLGPGSDQAFVYRVLDMELTVIYVGKTVVEPGARVGTHRTSADWWKQAAHVEVCTVPASEVAAVERAEIHRWHPLGNKICYVCESWDYATRSARHPLYELWKGVTRNHGRGRVCRQWLALNTFAADVRALGPKPAGTVLRLRDPAGIYEPGNICWGRPGPYLWR